MHINRKARLLMPMLAVLFALYLLPGCNIDTSGSGGSDWTDATPLQMCKAHLTGTWVFKTPNASGHITFSENEKVTGITMTSCFGMTAKAAKSITRIEGDKIVIYYVAVCNGQAFGYTLEVKPITITDCNTMTGTKTGNYRGGTTENFRMKKL